MFGTEPRWNHEHEKADWQNEKDEGDMERERERENGFEGISTQMRAFRVIMVQRVRRPVASVTAILGAKSVLSGSGLIRYSDE